MAIALLAAINAVAWGYAIREVGNPILAPEFLSRLVFNRFFILAMGSAFVAALLSYVVHLGARRAAWAEGVGWNRADHRRYCARWKMVVSQEGAHPKARPCLKIGFVSAYPPATCGIAGYAFRLVKELSKSNSVVVFADVSGHSSNPDNANGMLILRIWKRGFLFLPTIFWHVIREKVDIVHIQHEYLLYGRPYSSGLFPVLPFLLRLLGKKVIITMHSVVPRSSLRPAFFERYGIGGKFATLKKLATIGVTKLIGLFANKVIVHSELAMKTLVEEYRIKENKIRVISHGFDNLNSDRSIASEQTQEFTITYFGFVRPGKGIEYVIKAMPQVLEVYPNVKLMIVGSYHPYLTPEGIRYLARLEELVNELNLSGKVLLTRRFIHDDELPSYFSTTDVFVMPYTEGDIIGASGVLSKIACYGKPIVATNIPRFADVINGKHCLAVPVRSEGAIAGAIIKLLSGPSPAQSLGQQLRELCKKNSWREIAKRTLDLYIELLRR